MLASFQGLSWLQRWKGTPDSPSERTRPRSHRHRARLGVESLEPRWLLSTMGASGEELEPVAEFVDVTADTKPTTLSSTTIPQNQVSLPDDWSTAFFVPVANLAQVNGNPSLDTGPDLLEIYLGKGSTRFDFTLKSAWNNQPLAEGIQVLDANFKEYANYAANSNGQSIIFSVRIDSETTSSLFVKISLPPGLGGASGSDSNSFPYVLAIQRTWFRDAPQCGGPSAPPGDTDLYGSAPLPPVSEITLGPSPGSPPGPGNESNPGSADPNADPPLPYGTAPLPNGPIRGEGSATISLPVPVGPLPLRSTAPLGGALAAPDSVPAVDRHEPARADLAAFDPARALEDIDLKPRQAVPVAAPEAVQVITLRGPGGLPLLATALIAGSTVAVRTDSGSTAAQAEGKAESVKATPATGPVVTQVRATSLSAEQTSSTSSSRTTTESSGRTAKRSHRSSIVPGLTLAFALGVGLVLPDLVASLQFLAPSRPLLRLRLIRRAFKGR